MILTSIKSVRSGIRNYLQNKIPFTYSVSLNSISVQCEKGSFKSNNNKFPAHELSFIKQVKNSIISNGLHYAIEDKGKDPVYFSYNNNLKEGMVFNTIYNIDIKSAYWQTAYKMGLLSDDLYKKGMDETKISKKTRLAAIGTLAKKVSIYQFDGYIQKFIRDEVQETDFLWDNICSEVGDVLLDIAKSIGKDFIFFWVDGIYVSSKASADKAHSLFKKKGYNSVVQKLVSASVSKNKILVKTGKPKEKIVGGVKTITDIKPFHFEKREKV